jgi:hypothetical protein
VVKSLVYIKMWFIFSTSVLIRHLFQLKTVVFLYRCLIRVCSIRTKQVGLFQLCYTKKSFIGSCPRNFSLQNVTRWQNLSWGLCYKTFYFRNCCCIKSVCHCHSLPRYLCRSMLEPTTVVPLPLLW